MGEAENELRDVPRRIARERVPTVGVGRDLHGFLMLRRMGGRRTEATSSVRASNKGISYTNLPPDSTGNRGSTC